MPKEILSQLQQKILDSECLIINNILSKKTKLYPDKQIFIHTEKIHNILTILDNRITQINQN